MDMENDLHPLVAEIPENERYQVPGEGITMTVKGIPVDGAYRISVSIKNPEISIEATIPN
jgi:hypothetical protein